MSKSTKTTKATKSTNSTENTKVTKETKNAKDAKSAKETKSMENTKNTKETKSTKETKPQRETISRETISASIQAMLVKNDVAFTINNKGSFQIKLKDADGKSYSATLAIFKKTGSYRMHCSEKLVKRVHATEDQTEFHQGWAPAYVLNMPMDKVLAELAKAEKKEETPAE